MKKKILIAIIALFATGSLSAQVYIKTNALAFAGAVPNLGFEFGLSDHSTLGIEGYYSPIWNSEKLTVKGFLVTPEYRYYLCESFRGHYFGLHGNYANYSDVSTLNSPVYRDGTALGLGWTYGYAWRLSHSWMLDAYIGAGWMQFKSDIIENGAKITHQKDVVENKFFLDRIGVSFGYRF